jgi:hypothetical protein
MGGAGADSGNNTDGGAGAEGDGDDDGGEKAAVVPDTYELKPFTVGEGDAAQQIEIDTALLEAVSPTLKEAGLTQAQLDKLAPTVLELEQRFQERNAEAYATMKADWAKQVKDDPEIGGKKLPETLQNVAKALDNFGSKSVKDKDGNETDSFRLLLNQSGLGNHPVMVRMFAKIGEAVGEDGTLPRGDRGHGQPKDRLEVLYPDDVPKQS